MDKARKKVSRGLFIQYHNYGKLLYYPGAPDDPDEGQHPAINARHYISTKKKITTLRPNLDSILLILGIKIKKVTNYFSWSVMNYEDWDFFADEELPYNLSGEQMYFYPPIRLNAKDGFSSFRQRQGNFGLGFQNVTNDPWAPELNMIINKGIYLKNKKLSWYDWIKNFEKTYGIDPIDTRASSFEAKTESLDL